MQRFVSAWEREVEEAKALISSETCYSVYVLGGNCQAMYEGEKERATSGKHQAIARHTWECVRMCVFRCSSGLWLVNLQVMGSFNAWHTAWE